MKTKSKLLILSGAALLAALTASSTLFLKTNFLVNKAETTSYSLLLNTFEQAELMNTNGGRNGYAYTSSGNKIDAKLYGDLEEVTNCLGRVESDGGGSFTLGSHSSGVLNLTKFEIDFRGVSLEDNMEIKVYELGVGYLVNETTDSAGKYTYTVTPNEGNECRIEVDFVGVVIISSILIEYSC